MASYRYRAEIPAKTLGVSLNDFDAGTLIFAKPMPGDDDLARTADRVIVDVCDDHLQTPLYQSMLAQADAVTCATPVMAEKIPGALIVPDCYEFEERLPHCSGARLLWFGHATNFKSLLRVMLKVSKYHLRAVSNVPGCIPWSMDTMRREFSIADIVILPATKDYKSPNRAIESVRQGCFVVAEPHPSLDIPGIWIGDIAEGIRWAKHNVTEANARTLEAQAYVRKRYSPQTQACAWRKVLESLGCTLAPESTIGTGGSTSISTPEQMSTVT
jgi:hypothetical protein